MANENNEIKKHILSILVDNLPGVLSRIAGLFSGRGFNIESLCVAETADPLISRITLVTMGSDSIVEQVNKQLNKLINVIKISELDPRDSTERELMLLTVKAPSGSRSEILELVALFEGSVVDVGATELTISLDDAPERLDDLEALLRPYGIADLQRTGRVALPRLERNGAKPRLRSAG